MPARRATTSAGLAAALAAVVFLTGCDATSTASDAPTRPGTTTVAEDTAATPEAGPTAPPTVEPTPASSDGPAANLPVPVLPELAEEQSADGLEAFAAHWLALLSYSYEADDLGPLLAITAPGCRFCVEADTAMAQIYRIGWAVGGETTLTGFDTDFTPDDGGTYTADITTTQAEIFYFSGEGWLGSSESRADTPHLLTARYLDGRWQAIEYTTPSAG